MPITARIGVLMTSTAIQQRSTGVTFSPTQRMEYAVDNVREKLVRAATALNVAKIPYAVTGGNAVLTWVTQVDVAAARNTNDVDILVRREDLAAITEALESTGFVYRHAAGIDMFLDGPDGQFRDAVHILFAEEKVREEYFAPAASVDESEQVGFIRVVSLEPLVRMKLTSFRDKDRMHLRDLIGVGLVDADWPQRFQPELAQRLQQILDDPDG